MAHVKSAGGKVWQKANVRGKRRGVKANHKQIVKPGSIIVRQLGTKYLPGANTKLTRNFDIISKIQGIVHFTKVLKNRKLKTRVDVLPIEAK